MTPGAAAPSPGGESVTSYKREASLATSPDGSTAGSAPPDSKKKKTGPGSRGVANLTPDQLAKKRANGEWCFLCCLLHGVGFHLQSLPILLLIPQSPSLLCLVSNP